MTGLNSLALLKWRSGLFQQLIHIPVIGDLTLGFEHAHVFGILQEFGSENEIIQQFIFTENDLLIGTLPFLQSLLLQAPKTGENPVGCDSPYNLSLIHI